MAGRWFFFVGILFSLGTVYALTPEDKSGLKSALHPFIMECVKEFGVTEEQFEEAKEKKSATDIDPCFLSCFLKKAEFFDSKGMFDYDKSMSFAKDHLSSEEAIQEFEKVASDCAKVNDEESDGDESCERAKLMFDCLAEHRKEVAHLDG